MYVINVWSSANAELDFQCILFRF